jgi:hypothetical protein
MPRLRQFVLSLYCSHSLLFTCMCLRLVLCFLCMVSGCEYLITKPKVSTMSGRQSCNKKVGKITLYLPKFMAVFNSTSKISIFTMHPPNFQILQFDHFFKKNFKMLTSQVKKMKGKTSLTFPEFSRFLQAPSNIQKLSFRCIKLCPFCTKKSFLMPILPLIPKLHRFQNSAVLVLANGVVLESRVN